MLAYFIPAAGDHGLWPWRNVQSCDRDVAPHGREAGDHRLCPWGSIFSLSCPGLIGIVDDRKGLKIEVSIVILKSISESSSMW
jgi:hypothetical protein